MRIRRPLAALVIGLAVVGGGVLSGCSSPQDANRGIPNDPVPATATSTGLLPHNGGQVPNEAPERGGGGNNGGRP